MRRELSLDRRAMHLHDSQETALKCTTKGIKPGIDIPVTKARNEMMTERDSYQCSAYLCMLVIF